VCRRRWGAAALWAFVAFSGLQCVQDLIVSPPQTTYVFSLNPDSAVVNVGDTIAPFTGTLTADGREVGFTPGFTVVEGANVARVDSLGRLIVLGRGVARLRVRPLSVALPVDTIADTVTVWAVVPRIGLLAAHTADTLVSLGDTLVLRAVALTTRGDTIGNAPIVWQQVSGQGAVSLLDATTGRVRAEANGNAEFEATVDTAHARRTVRVVQRPTTLINTADTVRLRALGQTRSLGATFRDARANAVAFLTPAWQSKNTGIATVSTTGLITAVGEGTTQIIASYSGTGANLADTTTVEVQQAQLAILSGDAQSGTVGAALSAPFAVQLVNGVGTAIRDSGVAVIFGVTSGGGHFGAATDTLRTADTVRTDDQGQARTTATPGKLVGANAFSASGPGLVGTALTFVATGTPAPARTIAADSGQAQTDTVARQLAQPFVVTVRDTFGNAVPGVPVRFVVTAGGGKFGGWDSVITTTDSLGRARPRFDQLGPTATPLTLGTVAGANVVEARAAVPVGAPVVFTANGEPDVAVRLAFVVEPSDLDAGGSFSPTVEVTAQDGYGNVQPNPARQVTLSLVPPAGAEGAALLGTLTVTTSGERAEFPGLTLALAAQGYRLVASATGLADDTSAVFTVRPGAADHLAWLVPPSTGVAGRVFGPPLQVAVLDANENRVPAPADVTVEVYTVPVGGSAAVFGTPTVPTAGGVATFGDVGLANAGSGYRLRARAVTASGQLTVVSGYFDVRGTPASIHLVSGNDQNGTAGAALAAPFVVEVRDVAGRGVPRDTVVFQVETGGGSFAGAGSVRLVTGSDGRAAATLTLGGTSGANTATARSVSLAGQSVTFTATGVSGVLHLVFTTQPGGVALGSTFAPSPVVEVRDELNLTVTTNLRITLAITSGTGTAGAVLVGTVSVDAVGGVATFPGLGVSRAGSGYTMTATAGTLGPAVSTVFAVTGTAVTIEYVSGQSQNGLVGTQLAEDFVVRVKDAAGDPVAGDTVVFKLVSQPGTDGTLTAGGVTRPDTVLALTDGQGYARARLTLGSAPGSTVATAWIARIGDPPGVGFTASATVAGRILEFIIQPGTIQAGGAFDPPVQVRVRDALSNTDLAATTSITLRVVGGTGLTGVFTAAAVNGVATFSGVGMTQVGAGYALEAVATSLVPDTSTTFDVTSGPATRLAFQGSVGIATAGTPFGATVWMVDGLGNRVTSWIGDVRGYITTERGVLGAHLSGTLTVTTVNGVAEFTDLALDSAGAGYTLTFEVPEGVELGRDTSNTFAVAPGAAARLSFAVAPSGATAGAAMSPAVEARVQDVLGNTVTGSNAAVTLALGDNPADGALTGTTAVSASSGVALFTNLRIRKAGEGYTLVATATGLAPDTSAAFTVSAAPPSWLAFVQQPTDALTSAVISPAVRVALQDSVGNVVTGDAREVSLAITSGTGTPGAVLAGTTPVAVNATDGLATFGDISIALAGTGYTLTATADGMASAVSNGFGVLTGEKRLTFEVEPTSAVAGQAFGTTVQVAIRDQSGNVVPTAADAVTLAITGGTGTAGAHLRGTLTQPAVEGIATFPGLNVDSVGAGYTLTATAPDLFSATSVPFAVLPGPAAALVFLIQPSSRTAGNAFSPALEVVLRDALGNLATTTITDVALDITSGTGAPGATLAGTRTVTTVGGVATFADLGIAKAGTGYTLTASAAGLPSVPSATFSITAGAVARVTVSPAGASISGVETTQAFAATAEDSLGNVVSGSTLAWTSLNPAVATVNPSTGVATAVSAGQVTISATAGGVTGYALLTVLVPGATPVNLWAPMTSGTTQWLNAVWGTSGSDIYAVGNGGTILRYNGTTWSPMSSGTTRDLLGIWGASGSDITAVGPSGTLLRYNGTTWSETASGTDNMLFAVWGTSGSDVYAVGLSGTIRRYDGTNWTAMASATPQNIYGIWGTSNSDIYAVARNGAIVRYNGTTWSTMTSGSTENFLDIWGTSPSDIYAAGASGSILRYNGTNWSAMTTPAALGFSGIRGTSGSDIYAVGTGGKILRYGGVTWDTMPSGTSASLQGVWGTSNSDVYAVGLDGTILRGVRGATVTVTPATPTLTALGATQQLLATVKDAANHDVPNITGWAWSSATPAVATVDASTGVVTAVANGTAVITAMAPGGAVGSTTVTVSQVAKAIAVSPAGASLSGVGTTTTLTVTAQDSLGNPMPSPTVTWTSLNPNVATIDAAGVATAVSSGQVAVAATAGGVTGYALLTVAAPPATPVSLWMTASSSTGNNLLSVWAANPNDVWAVGAGGTAVHFNGTNWTGVLTRTTSSLLDVWGLGPATVYAVGNSGVMLRYSGSAWDTLPRFTTTTDLHAIWGTSPSDLFVTAGTQIWHYNGVAWSQQATLPNGLYGLWGTSGSDVWAVGAAGMVYRYDGTTWNAASSPTSQPIFAVQGTSANEVFVVADGVYRWNGASWSQLATGVSPSSWYLYDVWAATGSEVFVPGYSSTGNDGLVLRYDGSAFGTVLSNTAARLMAVGGTSGGSVFAVGPSGAIRRGIRATVTVTPGSQTLTALGTTVQLTAEVRDANGSLISGVPITWSSSDSSIAVPDGSGLVMAIGGGEATITAAAPGGASGTATVTVDIPVAQVIVTPAGATITTVGGTQAYAADLRDSYGNPSGGSYPVTWMSLNPAVATVDGGTGVVTGVGAGQATIAATANGMTGYALVTVAVPATTPVNLWGTVSSPTGNELSSVWVANASDAWAVGSGGTAVHFNGTSWSGVLTGTTDALNGLWGASSTEAYAVGANGRILRYGGSTWDTLPRFTTTTSLEAIWGASPKDLFVTAGTEIYHYNGTVWRSQANLPGAVNALWGTSGSDVWAVGGGGQVYRYDGTSWNQVYSPTSADIVTVWGTSPTNVYIGCHSGKAFRWDGATWNDITPPQDLTSWPWGYWDWQYVGEFWGSTPTDLYATLVHPSAVPEDWIAHYDGSSWTVVWHETTGLYALRGTSNGSVHAVGGSGRIVRGYRASIAVTPANPTITALGATLQLSGQAQDANGSTIPGVTVTWSSINPAVATVDASTGVVTAVANGTAVITATAPGGASGSTTVTVSQTVKTVAVNPAGASLGGGSTTFTVSVQDSLGSAIASPAVTWTSLNPAVATVGVSTGEATAVASGQVAISATVGGITAYGVLTVAIGGATPVNLWAPMSSPTTQALWGVWARSRTEAYAVGSAGTVLRYDGSQWTSMPSNTTASLYAVSGSSSSDLHAVGSSSAVLHYDGAWHQVTSPYSDSYLDGVWAGSPVSAFAVGAYRAARYDGVRWTSMGSMVSDLMAVWGTSPASVFAVGYGGHPYRYDGTQWTQMPSPTGLPLHGVWGADSSYIFAVGTGGVIRYSAGSWTQMGEPNTASLTAVWGTSSTDAYTVGWDGAIWRFNGTVWSAVSSPTTSSLFAVSGAPGGDVFAVGSGGTILRGYRGATVAAAPASPTITALGATVQLAAEVRDANGALVPGVMFSWSSLDAGVATVSASGVVTAVANGTALIVAAVPGGVADTATVTVSQSAATQRFVAGTTHSCSLTAGGTAYCWGENAYGQLGDGTTTQRATPVAVAGGLSFQALSAGSSHTCGLTTGGAAYCWGLNSFGDLGDGTTTRRTTPVAVVGGLTFRALGAGSEHTCGITTGGAAYCWGRGDVGQLGDGTTSHSTSPVAVAGGLTFQALSAGSMYTCGLTTGGAGFCWGDNFYGKLGDGTTSNRASPVAVVGGLTFQALTTGADADQTCGLTAGGAAYCWGHNNEGQVGDGTTSDRTSPVVVAGGLAFQALSAGGSYLGGSTCGLTTGGAAYCWGGNTYGQLGDGTATQRTTPVAVSTAEVFESLAAGSEHTCGRTSGGAAYCWGHNDLDQLGAGDTLSISRTTPVAVSTSLILQALVARSGEHTCGLTSAGAAYCWGLNTNGQLGDGTTTQRATPVAVSTAQVFHSLAIGPQHTCGLTSAGAAYCWGYNNHSQLGDGTTTQRTTPVVVNTTEVFQSLVAGSEHTCGLTSAGAAYCWGYNIHGQLGDGTTTTQTTPVAVSTAQVFHSLTAGDDHTCGLTSDGAAYCWGYNLYGRLGDGTTTQQTTPVAVSTTQLFQSLAAGSEHTCGVTSGGAAYCWGRNTYGQLGDGTTTLKTTPVAVSTAQVFQSLAAGSEHTCGATSAGAAYCWGYNLYGRLGDGTKTQRTTPVAVSTAQVFQSVAAGSGHSCGLTSGGAAYCWGWNEYGQLGLGWSGSFVSPVAVTGGITFLAPPMAMR
jgi:alpha-tubulin suppressor-like RCC1 family protein